MKVSFKSIPDNYELEKSGLKPNTIREEATLDEERKLKLRYFNKGQDNLYITITNTKTNGCFKRKVTDVSYWKGWFIISWNPNPTFLLQKNEQLKKELLKQSSKLCVTHDIMEHNCGMGWSRFVSLTTAELLIDKVLNKREVLKKCLKD